MIAISKSYLPALKISIILQVSALLLSSVVMCGTVFWYVITALIAYWAGILMMVIARPAKPTRVDIIIVYLGFPFILLVLIPAATLIANAAGLQVPTLW